MSAAGMQIELGQTTDPGRDPHKRNNEDAFGEANTQVGRLFVVCDGMGGHAGGKEAADIAVRSVIEVVAQAPPGSDAVQVLRSAIEYAGRRVYEFGGPADNPQRPGSTCVALLFHHGYVDVAHVGDSRAYAIRGKQIFRLTRDHSMVQDMIDSGALTEAQAIMHPDGNKITRALGMRAEVEVEVRDEAMECFDGDVFVMATDGLTDLAQNNDIVLTVNSYLKQADVQTAANELVALANRRGGHDNITVQVMRVLRAGPKTAQTRIQEPRAAGPSTLMQGPAGLTPPTVMQEPVRSQPQQASGGSGMLYMILAMAGVIGLLVAVLIFVVKGQKKPEPPPADSEEEVDTAPPPPPPPPPPKPKSSAKPKGSASAGASASASASKSANAKTKAPATKK